MTTDLPAGLDARDNTTPISRGCGGDGVMLDPVTGELIDEKALAEQLLAQGVSLVGPGGLLSSLTKQGAGDRAGSRADQPSRA